MISNILKTTLVAATVALTLGSSFATSASAHGTASGARSTFNFGHGPRGGMHMGGGDHHMGHGYRWNSGYRYGWPYRGYGYGYGYVVGGGSCEPGFFRNYWGHCLPNYRRY